MKQRKENGKIYLNFGYNMDFANKLKKYCGAKWNAETKEWFFDGEFEEKSNDLMLKEFGFSYRSDEKFTAEFSAWDFYNFKRGVGSISINNLKFVWRGSRDSDISMKSGVIIMKGEFPRRGGSSKYPDVAIKEEDNIVLRVTMHREFYDTLSEEDKSKITIISEASQKEKLLMKKEQLMKELKEIENELRSLS